MSALIQALLAGAFFTMIFDFFLYLGIWFHYIQAQEIEEFFNPFFWDNQNLIFLTSLIFIIALIVSLMPRILTSIIITILLILSLSTTLIPSFGYYLGTIILQSDYITFKDSRYTYHGHVIYEGRKEIYIYDTDVNKTFQLNKKDLSL